ncbi:hypothetical protein RCG23_19645 [Neobacillus sp. PS3-34]|uniref:hypothetical protein n=1 Tax=Neobacillus sp. PS3-34 TaxID=3070678 RepID=UPI0027E0D8B2|nr:hypothetical protein [Neobacillus sp. PS3-34]WML47582.1 hypothetical protein RCG23_19645 [Neobacillus sp. PS3-34]
MNLKEMIDQSFPVQTDEDWKREAERTLKGKPIETLESLTYENIILKPLYSEINPDSIPDYPAGSDYRRGIHSAPAKWKVAKESLLKQ